jgi:4-amino-4-deoxy-L-arabinose transferase-like glycosyltransferase
MRGIHRPSHLVQTPWPPAAAKLAWISALYNQSVIWMARMKTQSSRIVLAGVVLLLALMALLADGAARRESATFDEIAHIGAGVSYLQKLDMRMNEEHPPLAKVLAAVPLVVRGVHADYSNVSWAFSGSGLFKQYLGEWVFGHWLIARWNDPIATVFWARQPMLFLTLVLGFVLFLYGSRLGDQWGGLLCLCAYATMPVMLAFGPLVLTDMAITLFAVLTLWAFASMWRSPSRRTVLLFGLALGGALLSKFSAGLLFFCFPAFILSLRWRPAPQQPADKAELRAWRRLRWWSLAKGILFAALVVYAVYFVLSWNEPTDSLGFLGTNTAALFLRRALMPPWIYLRGLAIFAFTTKPPAFILGHSYPHGVWFFFPVLFLLKSPLAFLLLLVLALAVGLVAKFRPVRLAAIPEGMELHWRAVWVFLVVFTGACILSRFQFSIRHFSVSIVLLILLLAPLPRALNRLRSSGWPAARAGVWLTAALALASVVTAVRAYPYYLPFLNSLSGGRPAYDLVADSNLDWNQGLLEVETFVRQRGLTSVLIDAYGFSDPTVYVPEGQLWNCQKAVPEDGGQWAVVSVNLIQESHNCLWLLPLPHEALAGGSMYAFQLPRVIPPPGTPGGPPLPENYRDFANSSTPGDLRLMFLNCIHDPQQLQPTWDRMAAQGRETQKQPSSSKAKE